MHESDLKKEEKKSHIANTCQFPLFYVLFILHTEKYVRYRKNTIRIYGNGLDEYDGKNLNVYLKDISIFHAMRRE